MIGSTFDNYMAVAAELAGKNQSDGSGQQLFWTCTSPAKGQTVELKMEEIAPSDGLVVPQSLPS